ncbi:LppU/SCO3897 family protein [Kitasatospora sp. NPDC001664]|uniref:LppU/SCO3897 family protein n=1 Tax=Kitasatospora albolonga TaxID=68173 RepID=UPI0035EAE252
MSTPQNPQGQPVPPSENGAPAPFAYDAAIQAEAAKPKKSMGKKLLSLLGILLVIVIVAVIKVAVRDAFTDGPVRAKVGDCVTVTGSENNPEVETVGCGESKATHTVSKVIDNTFDGNQCGDEFDALSQQLGSEKFVLCLTPKK